MKERVAIVGSRDYPDRWDVATYVHALPLETVVISGGARGVDTIAETTARSLGYEVEVIRPLEADIQRYGIRAALLLRNGYIVETAARVVAFWDGRSTGTADAIRKAQKLGKPVEVRRPFAVVTPKWALQAKLDLALGEEHLPDDTE